MWQASRLKKAAKKSHSGNFGASHIVPDEHFLGRTGLRGRKVWVALTVLALVYLVVTANLVVSASCPDLLPRPSPIPCGFRDQLASLVPRLPPPTGNERAGLWSTDCFSAYCL